MNPGKGLRILLVEDYPDCANSTALLLGLWGYEHEVARDGPAAVRAAQEYRPDVVLLDIALPGGLDGWAVARRIGDQPGARPLLIAVTGYGQDADRRHSAECGIHFHMTKPVDPDELRRLLDRWQVAKASELASGPDRRVGSASPAKVQT